MRVLYDENVSRHIVTAVSGFLRAPHEHTHVLDLKDWKGTPDIELYPRAAADGFEAIVTNDAKQMLRAHEVTAIAASGIHRIEYNHKGKGLDGIGIAVATVCAGLPLALKHLADVGGQQLIRLRTVQPEHWARLEVRDPEGVKSSETFLW